MQANTHIAVAAPHDVWAVGVMTFESVVQRPLFTTLEGIQMCAQGSTAYPWELPPEDQPESWRSSRLRAMIEPCLARDPLRRPTAEALLAAVGRMGQTTNT